MGLRIQTNIEAMDAHRNLLATSGKISQSMSRLSSGFRINKASDDAAGLAISEKLQTQVGGLGQAQRNAQDAVSLVQTAEGSMSEVQSMLQRVRDLAVQYNNGTLSNSDKAAITNEVGQLCDEIARIAAQTKFNGISLLTTARRSASRRATCSAPTPRSTSTRRCSRSGRRSRWRRSTRRSTTSRPRARPSARSRTGSSTRWPIWRPTRRI
jgi:flagellin